MQDDLPMYGPGKFEGQPRCHADIFTTALDGADDSISGDEYGGGWADLLRGPLDIGTEREDGTPYTEAERVYMESMRGGWIISGDSQGFVQVDGYETDAELMSAWNDLAREYGDSSGFPASPESRP